MAKYELQIDTTMDAVCEVCGRVYDPSEIPNDSRCEDCYTMLATPQIDDEKALVLDYEMPGELQLHLP